MPVRLIDSGVLFGVAIDAAARIKAPPRAGNQREALVSIIFSVVSLEGFLNEATEFASEFSKRTPNFEPQVVSVFADFMGEAKESRISLESKFILANWILVGKRVVKGSQPHQDFGLLVRLRNDLVHFKGNESFEKNATAEEVHQKLIARFEDKKILADDMGQESWISLIETKAVAEWSCRTAVRMVEDFISKAPQGGWRNFLESFQLHFQIHS